MLPMIVAAAHRKMLFGPDDLGADLKPSHSERGSYLGCIDAGMPNIGDIAGKQHVGDRPVHTVVVEDGAGLALFSEPGLLAPGRIVVDAIGRISHHQQWPGLS